MTRAALALALALALGCRGRRPPPPVAAPPPDVPAADVVVVNDIPAPQDVVIRDISEDAPRRAARAGAWRALPRVDLAGVMPIARWDDAPDRDGDELPDPMVAVHWNTVAARCIPVSAVRSCPPPSPEDPGPTDRDGALVLAYLTLYSGDADPAVDAGMGVARLLGTRRVWRSSAPPTVSLRAVEFAELGAGILARATLEVVDGEGATDVVDVADLFVGEGCERRAGDLLHHCRTETRGVAHAGGSVGVSAPSLAPLVYRTALARPFSGCAAPPAAWDARVQALFSNGVRVEVTRDEPSPARGGHVAIVREGDGVTVVERGAPGYRAPSSDNDVRVSAMDRLCRGDRVRWHVGERACHGVIPRDDAPLQGCAAPTSPLDPTQAQPVAVIAPPAETHATLLFTRGAELLAARIPRQCRRASIEPAVPWREAVPALTAASPDGSRVLFAQGMDLWVARSGRATPRVVNGFGTRLPRGTVRALAFLDNRTVAAVISTRFVTFTLDIEEDEALDPPDAVFADLGELRRGPR